MTSSYHYFRGERFEGKIFLQTSCLVVCVTECQPQLNCLNFSFFFFFFFLQIFNIFAVTFGQGQ